MKQNAQKIRLTKFKKVLKEEQHFAQLQLSEIVNSKVLLDELVESILTLINTFMKTYKP